MKKIKLENISQKENLLLLLQQKGEYLPAYCGGNGKCGKCRVRFAANAPDPTPKERELLQTDALADGWRLACEVCIEDAVAIEMDEAGDEREIFSETGFDPAAAGLVPEWEKKPALPDGVTASVVAVDIGTTTLAASRVEKAAGTVVQTVTSVNHQRAYGADVITRIKAACEGNGDQLQQSIIGDLRTMVGKLGLDFAKTQLIISGNTTMGHLLQGYACDTLGVAPYRPVDISLHTWQNMEILPGISTFVGADIVSGIMACSMDRREEISLLIDLGTNGEMVIGNKDRLLATSTAAGPAFEGGNIQCGVAGIPGAISSVEIVGKHPVVATIGGQAPIGLCGTGVLEAVCALQKAGLIDEMGLLDEAYAQNGYPLAGAVCFTAKDIREVQLAKAAIRAGIEVLIGEYGIGYDQVDRVYLAGGFGQKVNVAKAVAIGLMPGAFLKKTVAVGNSSLAGAVMVARRPRLAARFAEVADMAEEIALAENEDFNDLYMDHLFFQV